MDASTSPQQRNSLAFGRGALPQRISPNRAALDIVPTFEATLWFAALLAAICLEALVRKLVPTAPPVLLYFSKDLVLIGILLRFGVRRPAWNAATRIFSGFLPFMIGGFLITSLQIFNPAQASPLLGLIGLRAYWFWWLAPVVLPSVFTNVKHVRNAAVLLIACSLVIVALASYQYGQPPEAPVNAYAWGDPDAGVAVVSATQRVRVTSTFAFVSGFTNYVVIITPLIITLGLLFSGAVRWICFATGCLLAFAGLMSGSRSIVAWFVVTFPLMIGWRAFTTRTIIMVIVVMTLGFGGLWFFLPDTIQGMLDRFSNPEETRGRFELAAGAFAPVALLLFDYPAMGIGTGMMLSARQALGVLGGWQAEVEPHRILVELGLVGYLLVWMCRVGLIVALLRIRRALAAQGARSMARFALALIPTAFINQIVMDHVAQALFFLSFGILLAIAIQGAERSRQRAAAAG